MYGIYLGPCLFTFGPMYVLYRYWDPLEGTVALRVQGTKYGVCRVSMLGIIIIVLGTYLLFGYLDP